MSFNGNPNAVDFSKSWLIGLKSHAHSIGSDSRVDLLRFVD